MNRDTDYAIPDACSNVLDQPSHRELRAAWAFLVLIAVIEIAAEFIAPSQALRFFAIFLAIAAVSSSYAYFLTRFVKRQHGLNPPFSALLTMLMAYIGSAAVPIVGLGSMALRKAAPTEPFFNHAVFPLAYPAVITAYLSPVLDLFWRHWALNSMRAHSKREKAMQANNQAASAALTKLAEMEHIAFHDGLTNLPNRRYFERALGEACASSGALAGASDFAVMFFDFDKFKQINDVHGHAAGDEFLIAVAGRMKALLRSTDLAARLGGDEFAVLVRGGNAQAAAVALADRFGQGMREPFILSSVTLRTSASIGIAVGRGTDVRPDTLVNAADAAMYQAKQAGGARYELASLAA